MVGSGYIEVSVHHMDARPGPLIGATVWIRGSCFVLRCAFRSIYFRSSMFRALDVIPVRLDGYPLPPERGHGDRNVGLFYYRTSGVHDKIHSVMWIGPAERIE